MIRPVPAPNIRRRHWALKTTDQRSLPVSVPVAASRREPRAHHVRQSHERWTISK